MAETGPVIDARAARGKWKFIATTAAICLPAILMRSGAVSWPVELETFLYGVAVFGAAFLLSWGGEVAQLDISASLAIAFLAFVAVLPEYAVSLVFAWKAGVQDRLAAVTGVASAACGGGAHPTPCRELALANMTGGNRLLIGIGWAVVVLVWWRRSGERQVALTEHRRTELGFLLVATGWAFTIPIRGDVSLADLIVLGAIFVAYIWHSALQESEEPELVGPPLAIAALAKTRRRLVTLALFLFAAGMILAAAEPFADGLVATGQRLGVDKFLLVQWLAPLASEAPEMIVAILLVLRSKPGAGLSTLVSSKVNQWSLLVATIPLAYGIAHHSAAPMALGSRQVEEVFLTAAQSLFAIAVLANLSLSRGEAAVLLVTFLAQFPFEQTAVRYGFSAFFVLAAAGVIAVRHEARSGLAANIRAGLTPPWQSGVGRR